MGLFRRRPRFSVSVQIEQLVLEECGGRVFRGDGKDPHEFEQLVLKVSGRRSLSSRNKNIAFRLSVRDRDFRKQQSLPFRERFPFQGKLQRRWRRQKPQLIRFRLYGLPCKTKLSSVKKVLLAEFSVDLTQHLDRLFELDAPPMTSAAAITTPSGPVQPPVSSTTSPASSSDHPRALALRMFAAADSLCIGSHLTVLLDSIHIVKRESSKRRTDAASNATERRRQRDAQPHRQVEMVRTVPLMYRLQPLGGNAVPSSLALPLAGSSANSTESDCSSDSSASSSSDDGGCKPKVRTSRRAKRSVRRTSTATRASPSFLDISSKGQRDCSGGSQIVDKVATRRRSMATALCNTKAAETLRAEPACDDGDEMEEKEPSALSMSGNNADNDKTADTHSSMKIGHWHPRKLSSIPDDGEDEEKDDDHDVGTNQYEASDHDDRHLHHDAEDNDADDEDDRRSYSYVQGELDHRDAVIAALRAENRAQAALIVQLQAENRRLHAEAACRGPANPLIASMSSTTLATTSEAVYKLEQQRSVAAERGSATDSEWQVAKRSASVPFIMPPTAGATSATSSARSNSVVATAAQMRRVSLGRSRASDVFVLPEEQVFEGLVQEIQEEFRCLLPTRGGAISSA